MYGLAAVRAVTTLAGGSDPAALTAEGADLLLPVDQLGCLAVAALGLLELLGASTVLPTSAHGELPFAGCVDDVNYLITLLYATQARVINTVQ
mgnify:CR=1 FL=1